MNVRYARRKEFSLGIIYELERGSDCPWIAPTPKFVNLRIT